MQGKQCRLHYSHILAASLPPRYFEFARRKVPFIRLIYLVFRLHPMALQQDHRALDSISGGQPPFAGPLISTVKEKYCSISDGAMTSQPRKLRMFLLEARHTRETNPICPQSNPNMHSTASLPKLSCPKKVQQEFPKRQLPQPNSNSPFPPRVFF